MVLVYSVLMYFSSGLTTCYSHDLLKHMLLLLPIKEYAEGPEEIRGRSALRTRKVCMTYAGRPNTSTRKVFGFYRFASAVVGNSRPARVRAYADGQSLDGSVTTGYHSRPFRAYAEGPKMHEVRTRRVCVRCTRKGHIPRNTPVRGRSAYSCTAQRCIRIDDVRGGSRLLFIDHKGEQKPICTRNVRGFSQLAPRKTALCTQKVHAKQINLQHLGALSASCSDRLAKAAGLPYRATRPLSLHRCGSRARPPEAG